MRNLTDVAGATFFQRAMVESALVGALAGVVGVHVLLRRLPYFVVAMSHAMFPGVVIASFLGVSYLVGGAVAGLVVALAVSALGSTKVLDHSSAIGVVLAGSFALGVMLLTAQEGSSRDLSAFLVGSIVTVRTSEVVVTAVVAISVLVALALVHKELVFSVFDEAGSSAAGYRRVLLDLIVLVAVATVVVTVIPAVGTLLAVALLAVPAMTARLWADRIVSMMVVSGILGAAATMTGLCVSALFNVAAGGAIALTCTMVFIVSVVAQRAVTTTRHQSVVTVPSG